MAVKTHENLAAGCILADGRKEMLHFAKNAPFSMTGLAAKYMHASRLDKMISRLAFIIQEGLRGSRTF